MAAVAPAYGSLHRGLELLALVQDQGRLSIAELAQALDLPLSTTYRYVSALRGSGFLLEDGGFVLPGSRMAESSSQEAHLVQIAGPIVRRLRDRTGLSALVLVRVHTMALCLESASSPRRHRLYFQRGQVRPLGAGGSALPLLAFAPEQVIQEVLDHSTRPLTSAAPGPDVLAVLLPEIRENGVAVSRGQITPGLVAIGVPVIVDGRCLCSLSLVGEDADLPPGPITQERVAQVRAVAADLAAALPATIVKEAWSNAEA